MADFLSNLSNFVGGLFSSPQQNTTNNSYVPYNGPYSPAVYNAASMQQQGYAGTPYNSNIINAAHQLTGQVSPGGGASTSYGGGGSRQTAPTQSDPYAGIKNQISGGWDQYIGGLNDSLNGLGGQRTAQENTINDQYNSGAGDLNLQKTQGEQALNTQEDRTNQNQAKNLLGISDNIRNAFQSGNVFLGSQGAGDSSAANQYSYALTKLGSKARTDVVNNTANILGDINNRRTNLSNIFNNEMNKLSSAKDQAINQVAQWFANAQSQIQGQIGQAGLGKSQDLASLSQNVLNQALSQLGNINQQTASQQSALQGWAQQTAGQLAQAHQNLIAQGSTNYSMPQAGQVVGTPQISANGAIVVPAGYGGSTTNDKQQNTTPLFSFA